MKTEGHVVLEKAVVKGISTCMAVCGDIKAHGPESDDVRSPGVSGKDKGVLASFFQNEFVSGISKYGEDYLSASAFGYSLSPAGKSPLIGPGAEFGTGCAGILAAGASAYVYVTEGSGMCIVRLATVFGKKKFVRVISSDEGGEDVIDLANGSVLIACPESWIGEQLAEKSRINDIIYLFDPDDIISDDAFDKRLNELIGEGFTGCMAALAYKEH